MGVCRCLKPVEQQAMAFWWAVVAEPSTFANEQPLQWRPAGRGRATSRAQPGTGVAGSPSALATRAALHTDPPSCLPSYPPAKSSRYVSHSTSRIVKRNIEGLLFGNLDAQFAFFFFLNHESR